MGRFGFGAGVGGLLNMQLCGVNLMTNHYEAFMKNKQQVMNNKFRRFCEHIPRKIRPAIGLSMRKIRICH